MDPTEAMSARGIPKKTESTHLFHPRKRGRSWKGNLRDVAPLVPKTITFIPGKNNLGDSSLLPRIPQLEIDSTRFIPALPYARTMLLLDSNFNREHRIESYPVPG